MKNVLLLAASLLSSAPARAQVTYKVADAGYCVARARSGEEGAPQYWYAVDCKTGKNLYSKSKWCWLGRKDCLDKVESNLDDLMKPRGYELAAAFKFKSDRPYEKVWRKPGAPVKELCLVHGTGDRSGGSYEIDCGDGLVVAVSGLDRARGAIDGIRAYMDKKGYQYVDSFTFERDAYFPALLFERK